MSLFGFVKKEKIQTEDWEEMSINTIQKIITNQEKGNLDTLKILQLLENVMENQKNLSDNIEVMNKKINNLENHKMNPNLFSSYLNKKI